ncbi:hypothetical protein Nepgr_007213 [Nepenthes gracilis]|uniref:Glycosyltransferase N-terminal domain-containing protein n=1 Tax=Nepenthes gracilis TaxID=150966 RepID=A0AAD3S6E6_NEPGR|nr:hypothetical protein Nepgr_007213 [Nepenthes gracilis]
MDRSHGNEGLHVVMLPWLAMGHLTPFLHLSKRLAQKGFRVSFISTPKNINFISKNSSSSLPSLIQFISIPLPNLPNNTQLPRNAESSMDIQNSKQPLLKDAFDLLQDPIAAFLREAKPEWIIYDFTASWIPTIAAQIGASSAYFAVFSAATLAYFGPPNVLLNGGIRRRPEDYTVSPSWVHFESNIAYRLHEVKKFFQREKSDSADGRRFAGSISGSDFIAVRTSPELESEWIKLLPELYGKPVVPVGFLFPTAGGEGDEDHDEKLGVAIKEWLDQQVIDSVLYVALGTEATLTQEELTELAHGLEKSGLPFLWALRDSPESTRKVSEMLPEGFEEKLGSRGFVYIGWVPQVSILGHPSIRGFLTHCGWNSVIEGLGFGRVLVLLPIINDQGLVARLVEGRKLGVEIQRNESDGSLTRDSVAEMVRLAMVEREGEALRENARRMKSVIRDESNGSCFQTFIGYLEENKKFHC